ncbi:class I SAM-dependent methyltransferase [Streptomyces sp. LP05-1]|uniref:Class I SAM-dependent methyltransferase n=1 Tax=Streptomyces pyxinae TaxID=2970734 RepID=A0ABT2CC53_9ACTN|nr:class I SAM-dependent methyltransferase [Streptomyces sp. LP05-1]MCS0634992.1 class I SAM-dependent methyltransferase [Streptomyces sp. LP05-1]
MNPATTNTPGPRTGLIPVIPPGPGPGAQSAPGRVPSRAAPYDAFHTARARTTLVARFYAEAMGADHPAEVCASSSCDWPLLGLMTARLRMSPGALLVDAGCGTGGIGLWLTRALNCRLSGFDLSSVAVTQATRRRTRFGLHSGRAAFHIADLEHPGLTLASAAGIICVDALGRVTDRDAAVHELGRALAPGGRLLLTRAVRSGTAPTWEEQARAAGLMVEHVDERPGEPGMWQRLYRLWITHADRLRAEVGEVPARHMLEEAHRMLPTLSGRRAVLLTLRRPPADPPGSGRAVAGAAGTMSPTGEPDARPAAPERTPL